MNDAPKSLSEAMERAKTFGIDVSNPKEAIKVEGFYRATTGDFRGAVFDDRLIKAMISVLVWNSVKRTPEHPAHWQERG